MIERLVLTRFSLALFAAMMFTLGMNSRATGQETPIDTPDLIDRPIAEIQLEGLQRVHQQTVYNNIRSSVGGPFDPAVVRADVARLNRLGQFRFVEADAQLREDGSVLLLYRFTEQAIISEVQVVGNRLITDQDLLAVAPLVSGGPRDDFLIQNARRAMEELYRKRGHYLTTVTINQPELDRAGLLIFQVNEGPRVKVRVIEFQGNQAFEDDALWPEIKTRTAMFLFRKGELDEEQLTDDVAALDRFYKDRGYLDVRVDRQIEISPDGSEAKVTFVVAEGPRYTVRSIRTNTTEGKPLKVFAPEQIAAIIELKEGDVYSRELTRKSIAAIQEAYGAMGYMLSEDDRRQTRSESWMVLVDLTELRVADAAQVDVIFEILEGQQYRVGEVQVQGNFLSRDKIVRRELINVTPGRPFDTREIELSEDRLERTRLFNQARITVQREDPDEPGYRDVLVEVKERNTGSINFGVAVGSDSGLFGELSLSQNNFDITDTPETLNEMITGRAFRGGGQRFNATLRPGTEIFQYIMSLTEPHLFDTDYSGTISGQFRNRIYDEYDEQRFGVSLGGGRQFGDVWQANLRSRVERIELDNIEPEAPTEVFLDAGPDVLTTLGVGFARTTLPLIGRPGSGSRFELSYDRYGIFGGDIDFNLVNSEYTVFFTMNEDFLGRLTTLKFSTRVGYIWGGRAPTYERFYLGGRTLRGFEFRTVSPKGIRADNLQPSDEAVGGNFLFFVGTQYEFPLLGDALTGVFFVDSGTVTESPGFDPYRVSVGLGIRMAIPQFGPNPLAFDFAFPVLKDDSDEEQVFSFSIDLPF